MTNHLDLDNARYPDQIAKMTACLNSGTLPFLPENLVKDGQKIIKQGKYWYITKNRWPYEHTLHHYLIVANAYWTKITDITPEASVEVISLITWLCQKFSVPGGAICLRFGDTNYSGGTIDHLHWQFIVPDVAAKDYNRVHFAIGKKSDLLKK